MVTLTLRWREGDSIKEYTDEFKNPPEIILFRLYGHPTLGRTGGIRFVRSDERLDVYLCTDKGMRP